MSQIAPSPEQALDAIWRHVGRKAQTGSVFCTLCNGNDWDGGEVRHSEHCPLTVLTTVARALRTRDLQVAVVRAIGVEMHERVIGVQPDVPLWRVDQWANKLATAMQGVQPDQNPGEVPG